MTLAKLHYQRLWFPSPGTGGAIPSRAEFGMSKEQFDQAMPVEFWREVVDRVAREAPDTLLLAEAFWMMEGFFVRSLGMHRVYNSAFMNILRNEDNAKYRLIMKNTLEFDPEILKRYVNFMNNPDERTAVDQFGKGDKYFGIAMLMATMPGLPMFGHGQVEGFSEKYGMEFKRALWDEQVDSGLVERHEREIFPVLHRRALFAGVENFLLYDFFTSDGAVVEDVFAYSNGMGDERALVVYHNRFGDAHGWVRSSVGFSVKSPDGERYIMQRTLGEGLNLHADPNNYVIFRDQVTGLEFLRSSMEIIERGLYLSLHAYEYHCFLDFREVLDDEWGSYRQLNAYLAGRGVPNVRGALQDLLVQPVLQPLREILNAGYWDYLMNNRLRQASDTLPPGLFEDARARLDRLIEGVAQMSGVDTLPGAKERRQRVLDDLASGLRLALSLEVLEDRYPLPGSVQYAKAAGYLQEGPDGLKTEMYALLFGFVFLRGLGRLAESDDFDSVTLAWFEEWRFHSVLEEAARDFGLEPGAAQALPGALRMLVQQQGWVERLGKKRPEEVMESWLAQVAVQDYLHVHRFEDVLWFNAERFDRFVWWMVTLAVLSAASGPKASAALLVERITLAHRLAEKLRRAREKSEFQVARLLQALRERPENPPENKPA
jgi:hypothetical protein